MNKAITAIKVVGGVAVGIGVGLVMKNLVVATTPDDTKKIMKACIGIGSTVVAGLASAAACDKYNATFDKIVGRISKWASSEDTDNEETEKEEA